MNILLVSHELGQSGAPLALFNMVKSLISFGHNVDVISAFNGNIGNDLIENGVNVIIDSDIFKTNCISKHDLSKYDLIIFNTIVSLAFAKNVSNVNVRKICWVHEGEYAYELFSKCFGLYARNDIYDYHDLFNYVDEIYCVSEYSKHITEKYTNKPIEIFPYYIKDNCDRIIKTNKSTGKELKIGLFGTVEKRKGIELLDSAIKLLPTKIRDNISIILCGKLTNDVPYNVRFKYLGLVPHETLLDLYNQIDLLICPSLDDPLPISVCEALMMECPVAVSSKTGFYSLLSDTQYVFDCDKNDLKNCLCDIYKEKDELVEIGNGGRKIFLDYFTEDKFNENLVKIVGK